MVLWNSKYMFYGKKLLWLQTHEFRLKKNIFLIHCRVPWKQNEVFFNKILFLLGRIKHLIGNGNYKLGTKWLFLIGSISSSLLPKYFFLSCSPIMMQYRKTPLFMARDHKNQQYTSCVYEILEFCVCVQMISFLFIVHLWQWNGKSRSKENNFLRQFHFIRGLNLLMLPNEVHGTVFSTLPKISYYSFIGIEEAFVEACDLRCNNVPKVSLLNPCILHYLNKLIVCLS